MDDYKNFAWPYIAGFFDGEGSISANGGRPGRIQTGVQIQIAQKPRLVLDAIVEFLKRHDIAATVYGHHVHHLVIRGAASSLRFLECIRPWLIVKKTITEDAIRSLKMYPPIKGWRIALESRRLRATCRFGHTYEPNPLKPGTRHCRQCRLRTKREYATRSREARRHHG